MYRTPEGATAEIAFTDIQQGAPGLAHGGAIATAFDDVFGTAALAHSGPAVTATLTLRFLAPVRLETELKLVATIVEEQGRRISLEGRLSLDDECLAEASATFVRVDLEHFTRARG